MDSHPYHHPFQISDRPPYFFSDAWCWRSIWSWTCSLVAKRFVTLSISERGLVCKEKIKRRLRFRRRFTDLLLFLIRRWVLSPPWLRQRCLLLIVLVSLVSSYGGGLVSIEPTLLSQVLCCCFWCVSDFKILNRGGSRSVLVSRDFHEWLILCSSRLLLFPDSISELLSFAGYKVYGVAFIVHE